MDKLGIKKSTEDQLLKIVNALGDKTRLKIVQVLSKGEVSCSEIAAHFDMTAPSLSHHFKILQESGLLVTRKEGQFHFNSLNKQLLKNAMEVIAKMANL